MLSRNPGREEERGGSEDSGKIAGYMSDLRRLVVECCDFSVRACYVHVSCTLVLSRTFV